MQIRDRIKDFRRVPARTLRPHPRNWRTHPQAQHDALRGVLAEVGFADALLVRELADGALELVDGHLRAELSADELVPVLVLDVSEAEALKLLATLDPLAAMAESNGVLLRNLVADVETHNQSVRDLLDRLAADAAQIAGDAASREDLRVPASFQVVVECADEDEQRAVYERLTAEGLKCRVLSL